MKSTRQVFGSFASLVLIALLLNSTFASAMVVVSKKVSYYGTDFYSALDHGTKDDAMKTELKKVLKSGHVRQANQVDQIVPNCEGHKECYAHKAVGYDAARKFLFGYFYLIPHDSGYGVQEMYCDRVYTTPDFTRGNLPSPGMVPDNTIINVEHTWPQSRFTGKHPKEMQKSDLHHLFPTDSQMNSLRGNTTFGEVDRDLQKTKCAASKFGPGKSGGREIFEPPQSHKGRVARALFYFSIRYDIPISAEEEMALRKWNKEQPIDEKEIARNDEIFKAQGNRNPFVDYPGLADEIQDF